MASVPPSEPTTSSRHTSFYKEIARNRRRTAVMLLGFVLLLTGVGLAFDFLLGGGPGVVAVFVVIAIVMAFVSYFRSDKIALAVSRAKPADGPEYRRYHNLVEGL